MSSKTPIIRQTAWIALVPHISFMGLLMLSFFLLHSQAPVLYGIFTYLALSIGLKLFFTKDYQKGITLVKRHKIAEAIPYFERGYAFFSKHLWMDKYRYLALLGASGISYREIALCNIAFCYGQIGQRRKAVLYYQQALKEFPDSGLAQSALRLLLSDEKLETTTDVQK